MNFTCLLLLLFLLPASLLFAQNYAEVKHLLKKGQFKDIETMLQEQLKANPNDDSAHYYLGLAYFHQGKLEEASKHHERCIELHPNSSTYHLAFAQSLGRSVQKAGIFSQIGSVGRIKRSIEKAVELDPRSLNARFALVAFHMQAPGIVGGSWDEAMRQAKAFEAIDANKAQMLWCIVHFYKKEYDKYADKHLSIVPPKDESSLELYRDNFAYYGYTAASELLAKKDYERAGAISKKLVADFPDLHYGYAMSGRYLTEKGEYDAAITQLEKALALNRKWIAGHYYLGVAHQAKGDKRKSYSAV
ncbi:MAG: tetratricopeptide repeat protein [Chloroherpetonaceae bacterium]|nr:tetratricopeptide repeat protein [Chloroherpetonaceae bacterium]